MVKVDFGSGTDIEEFRNCTTQPDCESPKVTMFPAAPVHTVTTESFATSQPIAYQYFQKRGFTNEKMSELLAWMEDNQADAEEAMYHFLETSPDVWHNWIPQDVAEKVQQAL